MPKLPKNLRDQYGNLKDKYDTAQNAWDDIGDFSQKVTDSFDPEKLKESILASGLEDSLNEDMTPEERQAALAALESSGGGDGGQFKEQQEAPKQTKEKGNLRQAWGKNIRSTGLVTTLLTAGGTVILSLAGGAGLAQSLEKGLTNENANDTRTNLEMRRAFNKMIGSTGGACGKFSLSCKMKTATKEQIKKWKEGRFKVDAEVLDKDGKPKGGEQVLDDPDKQMADDDRARIKSVTDASGAVLDSPEKLDAATKSDPGIRDRFAKSFNLRVGDFLHSKFSTLLDKFGLSKAKPKAEESQRKNATEDKAKAKIEEKLAQNDPAKNKVKTSLKSVGGFATVAATGVQVACMLYNVTRISVGAVKALWVIDILRVMWPYMRLFSKIADGSATDADFDEIQTKFGALIDYISPTKSLDLQQKIQNNNLNADEKTLLNNFGIDADDLTDQDDKDKAIDQLKQITNKSAFDSQGLMMALYNDNTGLQSFSEKFSTSVIGGGTALVNGVLNQIKTTLAFGGDVKEGKRNIRTACIGANTVANAGAVAGAASCFVPGVGTVTCLAGFIFKAAAFITAFELVKKAALLLAPIIIAKTVENVDFSADLRGPALGNALAAAMGLLLTRKSQSSALRPALSLAAVDSFVAKTNNTYNQYGDQLAEYDARKTPFDASNQYSFMGQVINSLNPYAGQQATQPKTAFSFISNIMGVVGKNLFQPAMALHSEPALLTLSDQTLKSRTNNGVCPDTEKSEENMICIASSGQVVAVSSPRVLQWADEDASGKTDHLTEVIDWMQQKQDKPEGPDASSGTKDDSCYFFIQLLSADFSGMNTCSNSGELPSIDDKGKPIPGSQFEEYVKYCTDKRDLELGSTDADTDSGSTKEQAWHSGGQCGLSYDSNGKSSVEDIGNLIEDDYDPSKDTGKTSYMMDAFAYYYNMCYVQYAVANDVANCADDTPPATPATTPPATKGSITIDPGHTHNIPGTAFHPFTGNPSFTVKDSSGQGNEVNDTLTVANSIKTKLEAAGYTVKVLDQNMSFQQRADAAKGSALALSLHTNTDTAGYQTYYQMVGGWRADRQSSNCDSPPAGSQSITFSNAQTAATSKQYADTIHGIIGGSETPGHTFCGRDPNDVSSAGNLPWVQLLSPDTPWVYFEYNGGTALSSAGVEQYAGDIAKGIQAAVKPDNAAAAPAAAAAVAPGATP